MNKKLPRSRLLPSDPATELLALRAELERERAAHRDLATEHARSLAALRRRESYFRHLTEYSLDLITILDAEGTICFQSRSIERELGHAPEDYIGCDAFDFVHPEDAPEVRAAFARALHAHGNTPVLRFRFRHRDGTYRMLEGSGNNLLDDEVVRGIVFNSRDITEKRRLEEQFHQSQKVQAIGQLTGGVAHDFNNILTAIIGYCDISLPDFPPHAGGKTHTHLFEIRKAAFRAAALTRQLLAFSRKQILQPRVLSLDHVISEMDSMLHRVLGEHIDLLTVRNPTVGHVKADPGQIEQVLLNLAVNARDAMAIAGGSLTIETSNVTLDATYAAARAEVLPGPYILLAVTDTGCGMAPAIQARLFEPFFTTKEQGKGTGLGLATCHGIIKQSGGHIAVYSEPGLGTTVKVYLPRVFEPAEIYHPEDEAPEPPGAGHETLLLVEDEPMLRELGLSVLEDLGYHVLSAENGRDALRLLQEHPETPIDLIITDVVMPEMGGQELAAELRTSHPGTRIIFCSGYTEDAVLHSGVLQPGTYFLPKPYTIAAMAQKVRHAITAA